MIPGNMKQMGKLLAQAQKAQEKMQEEIAALRIAGAAGGGAVVATLDGKKNLVELTIASEVLEDRDAQLVADLVLAATAEASRQIDSEIERRMGALGSMLGLPPGFGL